MNTWILNKQLKCSVHWMNCSGCTKQTENILFKVIFKVNFQRNLRKYLIGYLVLGNSLHSPETDVLHNFQFRRLKYPHIHHHYHSLLHEVHIYFGLYSNSKSYHCLCRFHGHCNWLHLHMQLPRTKKKIQQIQMLGRIV